MNKARGLIQLMRVPNDIVIGLAVIVGEVMGIGHLPQLDVVLLGFLSGFFTCASIMVLNDVFDIEIDRINAPNRPLPSGLINVTTATVFSIFLFLMGMFTALLLSKLNLIVVIIFWLLGALYNWRLKKTGFLGNIIVSLSVAIPFFYGALAIGRGMDILVLLFSSMAFLTNLGREIIKGIMDVKGDLKGGVMTIAVKYGPSTAYSLSAFLILIAVLISPIPIFLGIVNVFLYTPLVAVTDLLLLYAVFKAHSQEHKDLYESKKLILYGMFVGILAFMFGVIAL